MGNRLAELPDTATPRERILAVLQDARVSIDRQQAICTMIERDSSATVETVITYVGKSLTEQIEAFTPWLVGRWRPDESAVTDECAQIAALTALWWVAADWGHKIMPPIDHEAIIATLKPEDVEMYRRALTLFKRLKFPLAQPGIYSNGDPMPEAK